MNSKDFIIVTGLSGAGKSLAADVLEDLGYFCVDNLPPLLIPKFAEMVAGSSSEIQKAALVSDVRGGRFFDHLLQALESLERMGIKYEILYLEASDEVLIKRYKESRRRHPLASAIESGSIVQSLELERAKLWSIKERASKVIDTSALSTSGFKEVLSNWLEKDQSERMAVSVVSFGYKYGLPLDADLVFDVRFLPNPYWVEELRPHNGTEKVIEDYLRSYPITADALERIGEFCRFLLPNYVAEGKAQLRIAVGCTGGEHRSVFVAKWLGETLAEEGYSCRIEHRDLGRRSSR